MSKFLVLSKQDIEKVFTIKDAIEAVEDAYRQKAEGTGIAWPMVYEQFEPGVADMDFRSGDLAASDLFGVKLTAWFSQNPAQGRPEIYGTTLICSDKTGEPLALLNAAAITGFRTGAAGALGAKYLARRDAKNLFVAGAGHQSTFQVAAALAVLPQLEQVTIWDPRATEAPVERAAAMTAEVEAILAAAGIERDVKIAATADPATAVPQADVIVTITPATDPVIKAEWVKPGTHISAVGADMPGKQEVDSAIHAAARLFVDDREQSVSSGELEVPVKQGAIRVEDIAAELGEVIAGKAEGRTSDDQITVFDTSGIAVQDLASSMIAYERALEQGIGSVVEL